MAGGYPGSSAWSRMARMRSSPRPAWRLWLGVLTAAGLVAAGCSSDSGDSGGAAGGLTGKPVVVGMINQEGSPEGSFPEVREDAEAAVEYVNQQLNGVDGRPLKLEPCITTGSPESSQACANRLRDKDPVAVIGGVDLGTSASLPVFEQAGIPYVSGSPTLGDELTSSTGFLFTGGAASDLLGEAKYITETLHATRVGVLSLIHI